MKVVSLKKFIWDPHPAKNNIICGGPGIELDLEPEQADRLIAKKYVKLLDNKSHSKVEVKDEPKKEDPSDPNPSAEDKEGQVEKEEESKKQEFDISSLSKDDLCAFAEANGIEVDRRKKIDNILQDVKEALGE